MAEYSGSTALRGARSPTKDSTVYNRGGYRAAPPIFETGEDGNLRQSTGNPVRTAGATPAPAAADATTPQTASAAPAFTRAFADVPRPQGSSLAGSLASTALTKVGGNVAGRAWDGLQSSLNSEAMRSAPLSVNPEGYGPASSTARLSESTFGPRAGTPDFAKDAVGSGGESAGDWAGDFGSGAADFAGATTDAAGNAVGWGLDGAAGDFAGAAGDAAGAAGDAAGFMPVAGPLVRLAQGDVGGFIGSVIGNLILPGLGGFIGGLFGGGGGCFITTAVCQHLGRADDCDELQTLRTLRDIHMAAREDWRALADDYDRIAPPLVAAIDAMPDSGASTYRRILDTHILPAVALTKAGDHASAVALYRAMVESLQSEFSTTGEPT